MRYVISGGRDFANPRYWDGPTVLIHLDMMRDALGQILLENESVFRGDIEYIFHGDAPGADTAADRYLRQCDMSRIIQARPAHWDLLGKGAGPIRNKEMAQEAGPRSGLISFWNGKSHGTRGMIKEALAAGFTEFHQYRY